jgi:hypothetical protein
MQYKVRFRPIERLGPTGWQRFEPIDPPGAMPAMPGAASKLPSFR